ncbi:GerW family sporulation protein [Cognataquiflexum rubidum]|uniref:GerW family sporulation protein n=1 Tax=Cognataquiflexum rubidum TaxID=2922273 RepID=UPI001F12C710|nr:GerW family sporulation protein [Cognataquiflexum rubidum]MCH6236038.1 GerW family sporulation protein [Cognataquiflexum rubidum]
MEPSTENLISKITEFLRNEAKTETVIGQQFQLGEFTCVPVMSIGMGFGVGGGEGKGTAPKQGEGEGHGSGGGAGMGIAPVGFLASKGSEIQFIAANNPKGFSAIIEKMPDLVNRFMEAKEKKN